MVRTWAEAVAVKLESKGWFSEVDMVGDSEKEVGQTELRAGNSRDSNVNTGNGGAPSQNGLQTEEAGLSYLFVSECPL